MIDSHRQDGAYRKIVATATGGDGRSDRMDLSRLGLYTAPSVLDRLATIRELTLAGNYIKQLPASFGVLRCLEDLQLQNNKLRFLPMSLGDLRRLKRLSIGKNQLTEITDSVRRCTSLSSLYADNNKLTELPDLPISLVSLSVAKNQIGPILPPSFTNLKFLRFADVSSNRIASLSHTIGRLARLERFVLSHNRLSVIDSSEEALHTMPNLTSLYLSHNDLVLLSEEIGDFPSLTQLDISYNKTLKEVPYSLGDLEHLQTLCLQGCALNTLPDGIDDLTTKLRDLDLTGNQIELLPDCIGEIQSLRCIWLTKNRLKTLPHTIGNLVRLRELYVDENILTDIPNEIGRLTSMTKLSLRYNRLTSLPAELSCCAKLRDLVVAQNKDIATFPPEMTALTNLQTLCLDVELLGTFTPSLLSWVTTLSDLQYSGKKQRTSK